MSQLCGIPECGQPAYARGLCDKHYRRQRKQGVPIEWTRAQRGVCVIPDCGKPHNAKGLCAAHYALLRKYGTATPDTKYRKGHVDVGGYRRLWVNGKMIFEHRYVMETILGRPLLRTEIVHHKDGDRLNNVPENLEIMTQTIHMTERHHGRRPLATTTDTHRRCPRCGETKMHEEFGKLGITSKRRRAYCLVCWNAYYAAFRVRHPRK